MQFSFHTKEEPVLELHDRSYSLEKVLNVLEIQRRNLSGSCAVLLPSQSTGTVLFRTQKVVNVFEIQKTELLPEQCSSHSGEYQNSFIGRKVLKIIL